MRFSCVVFKILRRGLPCAVCLSLVMGGGALVGAVQAKDPATASYVQRSVTTPEERSALASTLKGALVTKAKFVMQRIFSAQGLTLTSRGDVFQTSPGEWVWDQKLPFAQRYVFNEQTLRVERAGQPPEIHTLSESPNLQPYSALVKGLFTLDLSVLESYFTVDRFEQSSSGEGWILRLRPSDALLTKLFSVITLKGGPRLESVEMEDTQGDRTRITLSPIL